MGRHIPDMGALFAATIKFGFKLLAMRSAVPSSRATIASP
jgi:hypothetical protein